MGLSQSTESVDHFLDSPPPPRQSSSNKNNSNNNNSKEYETAGFECSFIFGFGNNSKGQLGLGEGAISSHCHTIKAARFAHQYTANQQIRLAASGGFFSLMISGNNEIYVCGENSYGQLGLDPQEHGTVTKLTNIRLPGCNGVKLLGCGRDFTIIVTTDNKLITLGRNNNNKLGRQTDGYGSWQCEPFGTGYYNFVQVACGTDHALLLTDEGQVLCAGSTRFGSTRPDEQDIGYDLWRLQVGFDYNIQKVTQISAGLFFSAYLVWDSQVYTMGSNRSGNCGTGSEADVFSPHCAFDALKVGSLGVKQIACVGRSLMVITREGDFYFCGEPLGPNYPNEKTLTKISSSLLGIPTCDIRLVSAGERHLVVVTEQNKLYVGGNNLYGQLGLEKQQTGKTMLIELEAVNEEVRRRKRVISHVCSGAYFNLVALSSSVQSSKLWTYQQNQRMTDIEITCQQ